MSLFHLFEQWYARKPRLFQSPADKLATIRRWIACYFKLKQQRKAQGYQYA